MKIYFVLPIYNEGENICRVVEGIRYHFKHQDYKIIAVNDGSSDNSLSILNQLSDTDLAICSYRVNMNIGTALSTGIEAVLSEAKDEDIMIFMESDQTSSLDTSLVLIQKMQNEPDDIVIASRYQHHGQYINFPWTRKILSLGANGFMKHFFPIAEQVYDYTIFFRAYRVKVLRKGYEYFGKFGLIRSKGFVANAELLVKLSMITTQICEVAFSYDYGRKKGKSKLKILRTIGEYLVVVSYLRSVQRSFRQGQNQYVSRPLVQN